MTHAHQHAEQHGHHDRPGGHSGPDARMHDLLAAIARASRLPMWAMSVEQARQVHEAASGVLDIAPPHLEEVVDLDCPMRDGSRRALRLYRPRAAAHEAGGALLYLHGGGFVIGSIASHDVLCRQLAQGSGCAVLSLDYRLAPEHPFPRAVEDSWDALTWLREHGAMLGLDPHRLAVGGDSAGGTLAAVTALQARDAGVPLALQLLFYPGTAGWAATASALHYAHGFLLEREHLDWFFHHYLRDMAQAQDWRFAPLLAGSFTGLAPVWMGLAGCDMLHDEGKLYAERLRHAGCRVELREWPGVTHDFIRMGRALPQAGEAVRAAAAALRAALHGGAR